MKSRTDLAIIILTYNEEKNLPHALDSVVGWAREIFVVDSYSEDRTLQIAHQYGCQVVQNHFENYSKQRNFAISNLPIKSKWIFFLDADEWLPKVLKEEISSKIQEEPDECGFLVKWRLIWMGRWIKWGYYPTWILRLARNGFVRCEDRGINEHLIVNGKVGRLRNDIIHEDRKGLAEWIDKHSRYARLEAEELVKREKRRIQREIPERLFGTQAERKRWLRHHVYERLPILIRPFVFWAYRYWLRGGFLGGVEAFVFHFFQSLWFPLLIDAYYLELKVRERLACRKA